MFAFSMFCQKLQKSLTNSENERRVIGERVDALQHTLNELRCSQQSQQDMLARQQEQMAELEVQKSTLESQLRIAKWNQENSDQIGVSKGVDDDLSRQLITVQRERTELRNKVDSLTDKIRQLEKSQQGGRSGGTQPSKFSGHVQFDRSEKSLYGADEMDSNRKDTDSIGGGRGGPYSLNASYQSAGGNGDLERENRELRMKIRRLETLLAEKEAELARAKAKLLEMPKGLPGDAERYRTAQIQAERLLDAREQSHRQQVLRLENQVNLTYTQI